jgi:hypothetical protein
MRSGTGTPRTSAYEHAAQPPAELEDAWTPVNFDDPDLPTLVGFSEIVIVI